MSTAQVRPWTEQLLYYIARGAEDRLQEAAASAATAAAQARSAPEAQTLRVIATGIATWPRSIEQLLSLILEAENPTWAAHPDWRQVLGVLICDVAASGVARTRTLPPQARREALAPILQNCELAVQLAAELGHEPCLAKWLFRSAYAWDAVPDKERARELYVAAADIYRGLAGQDAAVYGPDLAMALNNLGNVLRDRRELAGAEQAYREAEGLYRGLATQHPAVYAHEFSMILGALASVASDLGDTDQQYCWQSQLSDVAMHIPLHVEAASYLDRAARFFLRHDPAKAEHLFRASLRRGQLGVAALSSGEDEQLDLHKRMFESAICWGVEDAARHHGHPQGRLRDLLESLRRVQSRSLEMDQPPPEPGHQRHERSTPTPDEARLEERLAGQQAAAEQRRHTQWAALRSHGASLLYIQPTPQHVVFHLLAADGRAGTALAPPQLARLMSALWLLSFRLPGLACPSNATDATLSPPVQLRPVARDRGCLRRRIEEMGRQVWREVPAPVQHWLLDYGPRLWLCPHGQAGRWLWELVHGGRGPLGLSWSLPRVGSLEELAAVLDRQPRGGPCCLVGDPRRADCNPLPAANASAREIHELIQHCTPEPPVQLYLERSAHRAFVLNRWQRSDLSFFLFAGHGGAFRHGGALLLADGAVNAAAHGPTERHVAETLSGPDLLRAGVRWTNHPWVHLDCCHGGWERYEGGGRLLGLTHAALACGAAAVLASSHSVGDEDARCFASVFYRHWLRGQVPAADALLRARQALHDRDKDDPLLWALPTLHGNALAGAPFTLPADWPDGGTP